MLRNEKVSALRSRYPQGTIVQLVRMDDVQAPPVGARGTVEFVDDAGTIHVHWENGSGLGLVPDEDEFVVVDKPRNKEDESLLGGNNIILLKDNDLEEEYLLITPAKPNLIEQIIKKAQWDWQNDGKADYSLDDLIRERLDEHHVHYSIINCCDLPEIAI